MLSNNTRKELSMLVGWAQCACMDIARDSDETADQIYSDVEQMVDLLGDRVYEIVRHENQEWCAAVKYVAQLFPHLKDLEKMLMDLEP